MKAVFVTPYSLSGTVPPAWIGYRSVGILLAACLEQQSIELVRTEVLRERGKLWRGARQALRNIGASRRYLRFAEPGILRGYAQQLERQIAGSKADCVVCHGWLPVADAALSVPLIVHNDAPIVRLIDYYPYYSGITDDTVRALYEAEKKALAKAAIAVYASDWAADGVREVYPEYAHKVRVIPYGPALPAHCIPNDVEPLVEARSTTPRCELLFLGVDWERKRGPFALDIVRQLNAAGIPARLTVAGCSPRISETDKQWVDVRGFVDTRTEHGAQQLCALFCRSHLLVLPVQAEAFGLVFAEASAFAVPSFATATGGVPTAVRDGVGGILFSDSASAEDYCSAIIALMRSGAYRELAYSARRDYEERLHWKNIAQQWAMLLDSVLSYPNKQHG